MHDSAGSPISGLVQVHLYEEVQTASYLLATGTQALQGLDGGHLFTFFPIMLLAQGCERLGKVTAIVEYVITHGALPDKNYPRKYSHKIEALRERVFELMEEHGHGARGSALSADLAFLKTNEDLQTFLDLLGRFGSGGRYDHINFVVGDSVSSWSDDLEELRYELARSNSGEGLVYLVNRFARALARLFTWGPFGDRGRTISPPLHRFLVCRDEDLGVPLNIGPYHIARS